MEIFIGVQNSAVLKKAIGDLPTKTGQAMVMLLGGKYSASVSLVNGQIVETPPAQNTPDDIGNTWPQRSDHTVKLELVMQTKGLVLGMTGSRSSCHETGAAEFIRALAGPGYRVLKTSFDKEDKGNFDWKQSYQQYVGSANSGKYDLIQEFISTHGKEPTEEELVRFGKANYPANGWVVGLASAALSAVRMSSLTGPARAKAMIEAILA